MEHEFQLVDVLDESGAIIGQKPRREIDKTKDIYHTVFVLLVTPGGKIVLGRIPAREDLPNLYANQYGVSMATIRRHQETADEAAIRGLARELFIEDAKPVLLGEAMERADSNPPRLTSVFALQSDMPDAFSLTDIKELMPMTRARIETVLVKKPVQFAPTFRLIWEKYKDKLPIQHAS